MLKNIAFIRRTHGLDGSVLIALEQNSYINCFEMLNEAYEKKLNVFIDDKAFYIERLFGHIKIKNVIRYRVKFVGCDLEAAKQLCGECLAVEYSGFDYDSLIGLYIIENGKKLAEIQAIYDFGAGIICDTDEDMYSINDLDLSQIEQGVVIKK